MGAGNAQPQESVDKVVPDAPWETSTNTTEGRSNAELYATGQVSATSGGIDITETTASIQNE